MKQNTFINGLFIYHFLMILVALCIVFLRRKKCEIFQERAVLFINAFVFVESLNLVWFMKCADKLFNIRDAGVDVWMFHIFLIGILFLVGSFLSLFTSKERRLCILFAASSPVLSLVAALVA